MSRNSQAYPALLPCELSVISDQFAPSLSRPSFLRYLGASIWASDLADDLPAMAAAFRLTASAVHSRPVVGSAFETERPLSLVGVAGLDPLPSFACNVLIDRSSVPKQSNGLRLKAIW